MARFRWHRASLFNWLGERSGEALVFFPGVNFVDDAVAARMKAHPTVQHYMRTPAHDGSQPGAPMIHPCHLEWLEDAAPVAPTEAELLATISESVSEEALRELLASENASEAPRPAVVKALTAQLRAIDPKRPHDPNAKARLRATLPSAEVNVGHFGSETKATRSR